jgi:hypothetical protein
MSNKSRKVVKPVFSLAHPLVLRKEAMAEKNPEERGASPTSTKNWGWASVFFVGPATRGAASAPLHHVGKKVTRRLQAIGF